MATLKEQAVNMLQNVPDDKMSYVIEILRSLDGIMSGARQMPYAVAGISSDALEAWEDFKKIKGIIPYEIDIKAELAKARDEKYADFI
jgi:hypothetical protein